jgi:hypothetical protein
MGTGPVGGHASIGATPRSYQATPIGPRRCCGPHNGNWPRGHRALERTRNTEQPAINQPQPDIEAEHWIHLKTSNPVWVFSFPHQLALPEREMAGRWWQGPDSESDCCCSMDAFELEVSGAVTGREAIDGLA